MVEIDTSERRDNQGGVRPASYERPSLTKLGSVAAVTHGVDGPNPDTGNLSKGGGD
jgi:hypothetical protein